MADMKAFNAGSLAAVVNAIKQAQSTGEGVATDLTALAETVNNVLRDIGGALETLDSEKAYIAVSKDFTLSVGS